MLGQRNFLLVLLILWSARQTVFVRRRTAIEFDTVDTSAAVTAAITAGVLAILLTRAPLWRFGTRPRITAVGALHTYFLLCTASTLWSVNPTYTLYRAIEVWALATAVLIAMRTSLSLLDAESLFLRFTLTISLLSLAQHLLRGNYSISGLHTNVYTYTAALMASYSHAEIVNAGVQRKKMLRRYRAIAIPLVLLGTSIASNLALLTGLATAQLWRKQGKSAALPIVLLLSIVAGSGVGESLLEKTVLAGRDLDSISTLTGRTNLWGFYSESIASNPGLGLGHAIGPRVPVQAGQILTTNAHNGLIDAALGTGFTGLALLVTGLGLIFRSAAQMQRRGIVTSLGIIAGLTTFAVNNMSKTILGGALDVTTLPTIMLLGLPVVAQQYQMPGHSGTKFSAI